MTLGIIWWGSAEGLSKGRGEMGFSSEQKRKRTDRKLGTEGAIKCQASVHFANHLQWQKCCRKPKEFQTIELILNAETSSLEDQRHQWIPTPPRPEWVDVSIHCFPQYSIFWTTIISKIYQPGTSDKFTLLCVCVSASVCVCACVCLYVFVHVIASVIVNVFSLFFMEAGIS